MTPAFDRAFSSIDFVGQCLVDKKRTSLYQKAIETKVKPKHIVLDIGTGYGVLALFAAKMGAKEVIAVEFDQFIAEMAQKIINRNKYSEVISLIIKDARDMKFKDDIQFNIVIAEMLTTGMIEESQVQVINNLYCRSVVNRKTIFLPFCQKTYITLANTDFILFGLEFPIILHLWRWHDWGNLKIKKISEKTPLNVVSFNRGVVEEKFERVIVFKIKHSGLVNSILLTSNTFLTREIVITDTEALNAPMLIPISERFVCKNDIVQLKISYFFGSGYDNFRCEWVQVV